MTLTKSKVDTFRAVSQNPSLMCYSVSPLSCPLYFPPSSALSHTYILKTESHYADPAGLELTEIHLFLLPRYCDYRHMPPWPALKYSLIARENRLRCLSPHPQPKDLVHSFFPLSVFPESSVFLMVYYNLIKIPRHNFLINFWITSFKVSLIVTITVIIL